MPIDLKKLDLNDLVKTQENRFDLTLSPTEDSADADLRRMKEKWLFLAALFIVLSFAAGLATALMLFTLSIDAQKSMWAILGAIVGVAASVLTKK